jgi:hypothetical protein
VLAKHACDVFTALIALRGGAIWSDEIDLGGFYCVRPIPSATGQIRERSEPNHRVVRDMLAQPAQVTRSEHDENPIVR